jgi:hypothetical protein
MSTFNEEMTRLNQACREMRDVIEAELKQTPIGRGMLWALKKRDDALECLPPRALVILAVVLGVAFVVGWCWVMRGMQW